MNKYIRKGFGFGLTSGVITTLGMLIGLTTVSESKVIVAGGIVSIAIADAASDALGIHIAEESSEKIKTSSLWTATLSTFFSKFFFASTFLLPILFFQLKTAVIICLIWGYSLLVLFSYVIAKDKKENPLHAIVEHITIATIVLLIIHYTGKILNQI